MRFAFDGLRSLPPKPLGTIVDAYYMTHKPRRPQIKSTCMERSGGAEEEVEGEGGDDYIMKNQRLFQDNMHELQSRQFQGCVVLFCSCSYFVMFVLYNCCVYISFCFLVGVCVFVRVL